MSRSISLGSSRNGSKTISLVVLALGLVLGTVLQAQDVLHSNFENATLSDNPWAGVDGTGNITVLTGSQPLVNDEGTILNSTFGPSVAVGDLNGDGLQDLVIADSRGFFWYFANSGTPTQPKFTHGEIMPTWLGFSWGDPLAIGGSGAADNIVSKIQLVSLTDNPKILDIVAGNYVGRLFYIHNSGTPTQPIFRLPKDRGELIVPTRRNGVLWCNYISPFLYDWFGTGNLDLIMGDGSYSANSIYLLKNQGDRDRPTFNEDFTTKIIPGMGREHLTPQVVDWNNDGHADIIAGERTGHINLFTNSSTDPNNPSFDAGKNLMIGGKDTFGDLTTATVCDLNGNKLHNLIITNSQNQILYAQNVGKPGSPLFTEPQQLHGVNPFPKILRPFGWTLTSPAGVPNELLVLTNKTVQPDFIPPPAEVKLNSAMRYFVYPIHNTYFNDFYYPKVEGVENHGISYSGQVPMKPGVDYKVSFWIRTTGSINQLGYLIRGFGPNQEEVIMKNTVNSSGSWSQFTDTTNFTLKTSKATADTVVDFGFSLGFYGQGELYLDAVEIAPADSGN